MKTYLQFLAIVSLIISCQVENTIEKTAISSDGLEIAYTQYGNGGDLILFVHGWSCDQTYWQKQIDHFKDDYTVVTIDLGGHGRSGMDRENATISSFGDDVIAVMQLLNFEKTYLVGHSMGSDVCLDAGTKWDKKNIELILVDRFNNTPSPFVGEPFEKFIEPFNSNFKEYTYNWVKNVMFIPESDSTLIEWIAKDMSEAPPSIAIPAMTDICINDYIPYIDTLVERGIPMTIYNSDYQKNNIKNLEKLGFDVIIMSNSGHFLMMEQPDEFNQTLMGLIQN